MAALDFPASPTVGQTYSANGGMFAWNERDPRDFGDAPNVSSLAIWSQVSVDA